jgi:hypothetical protein
MRVVAPDLLFRLLLSPDFWKPMMNTVRAHALCEVLKVHVRDVQIGNRTPHCRRAVMSVVELRSE